MAMKSIKLSIIIWIIGLLFTCSTVFTQSIDSTSEADSIGVMVDVWVTMEPIEFNITHEPLEDNATIQAILKSDTEQISALNKNLNNLNQILVNQDPDFTELDLLFYYDIDLKQISKQEKIINSVWWLMTAILVLVLMAIVATRPLYFIKKNRPAIIYLSIGALLLFGYILPLLLKVLVIEDYELWVNVSKLF